jgi:hypothetical protein
VVKGYAQVAGLDFEETFAPVARLELLGTCSQMLRIKNKATQEMLGVKVLRPP